KNKNYQHHQNDGLKDRVIDGIDGALDKNRGIISNVNIHALGQVGAYIGQNFVQRFGNFQRIGHRLLDDTDADGALPVIADDQALILRADFDLGDITKTDQIALVVTDNHFLKLLLRAQVSLAEHRK